MPRNTTGGSGHKAQRNSEGSKAKHNRCFIDDLLDDIKNGEKLDGVYVARVTKRMGCGRMEVFYIREVEKDACMKLDASDKTKDKEAVVQIIPMRGGLRGKAKRTVWVDLDSLVMVAETGLGKTTHEIIAVFSAEQVARYRKLCPHADERLFLKSSTDGGDKDGGFEFAGEADGEVDVDNI
jgi:hypothetical protein